MQKSLFGTEISEVKIPEVKIIKSISFDQQEIISWIIQLYCPNGIELDPTFSKGNFYKIIKQPLYKYDYIPQAQGVIQSDCRNLPHKNNSIGSIMFDPPFIAAMPTKDASGIISKRFGFYKNVPEELWKMYYDSIDEFYRILKQNGVLIFKCQDTIEHNKQYLSHVEIINYAVSVGFYPKDLFILCAENRIIGKTHHKQQHARKYHSYFLVFIKMENSLVKYFGKDTYLNPKKL